MNGLPVLHYLFMTLLMSNFPFLFLARFELIVIFSKMFISVQDSNKQANSFNMESWPMIPTQLL